MSREADHYESNRRNHEIIIPEVLPASQDPAGNWGQPSDGMQLSLRFPHREFLQQEGKVYGIIILRNLSSSPHRVGFFGPHDYHYTLRHGTNTIHWPDPPTSNMLRVSTGNEVYIPSLKGHSEVVVIIWVNQRLFDLKEPGEYSLEAELTTIPASSGNGMTNVVSGTATFKIVKELSPAEVAARKADEK
jgi:hypothetical protein